MIEIFLLGLNVALIPVAFWYRKYSWLEVLIPTCGFLFISIMYAIEVPNPNWIKLIQVVTLK